MMRFWRLVANSVLGAGIGLSATAAAWGDRPPASDRAWPADELAEYDEYETAPARPAKPRTVPTNRVRATAEREPAPRTNPVRHATRPSTGNENGLRPAAAKAPAPVPAPAPVAARSNPTYAQRHEPVGSGLKESVRRVPADHGRSAQAERVASGERSTARVAVAAPASAPARRPAPARQRPVRPVHFYQPSADEVFEEVEGEVIYDDAESTVVDPLYVPDTEPYMIYDDECEDCDGPLGMYEPECCLIPCPPWGGLQAFFGTQGFTGPLNIGDTGSFGFHEGVNYGSQLPWGLFPALGWQIGARFTQSNLSGSALTDVQRNQSFMTMGLYRRAEYGFQVGAVVDLLHEDWYGEANLSQVRAELGWVYSPQLDYGVWIAVEGRGEMPTATVPLTPALSASLNSVWMPTDMFVGYIRRNFGDFEHGNARAYFGGTEHGDGILGADAFLPMTEHWSLQAGFTYLIPEESTGTGPNSGHAQESWNLGVSLMYTPGRLRGKNAYRPLFNVADNGSFFVDRQ